MIPIVETTAEEVRPFADAQWTQFNVEQGVTQEDFAKEKQYWCVPLDGAIRGYISFTISRGVAYIESCIVEPAYRGRGLAAAMVGLAEDIAKDNGGCHAAWAKTRSDNEAMRKVFQKRGYIEVEVPVPFELGVDWVMYFKEL